MIFPADPVLIARGKYSTLGKERRIQLERVQKTAANLMALCQQAMNGVQAEVADLKAIHSMQTNVDNLKDAGERIVELNEQMAPLKEEAWG